MLNDPAANAVLAGTAYHCYGGDPDVMTELHDTYPQKDIYETECSSTGASQVARPTIKLLISAMRNWAKTVVLWNVAVDTNSGPRQGNGCVGCIGLVTVDQSTGNVSYTNDYYQIGHASKFVVPGAYRIASNSFDQSLYGPGVIEDVAFKNPDGSKVLIAYNDAPATQTFKVRWGTKAFDYTLPPGATATFTWSGVQDGPAIGPTPPGPIYYAIDAGGTGADRFTADSYADGGRSFTTSAAIDTSAVSNAAPTQVYQSERLSPTGFSYSFPALQPGSLYGVRLHFAELTFNASRQRRFNVFINGKQVLSDFDIFAETGAQNKAIIKEFVTAVDSDGTITIRYSPGSDTPVPDNGDVPEANGIEIVDPSMLNPTSTSTSIAVTTGTATPQPTSTSVPAPTATNTNTPLPLPTNANTSITNANTPAPTPPIPQANTPTSATPLSTATGSPGLSIMSTPLGLRLPTATGTASARLPIRTSTPSSATPTTRRHLRTPLAPRSCQKIMIRVTVPRRPLANGSTIRAQGYVGPRDRVVLALTLAYTTTITRPHAPNSRRTKNIFLYREEVRTQADRNGHVTGMIRIKYEPRRFIRAILTVNMRTSCAKISHSASVVLTPMQRHPAQRQHVKVRPFNDPPMRRAVDLPGMQMVVRKV